MFARLEQAEDGVGEAFSLEGESGKLQNYREGQGNGQHSILELL